MIFGSTGMHVTDGIGVGDWFSAAGNLVGVVVAVAGAIYVESWKRKASTRADLRMIEGALRELDTSLEQLKQAPAPGLSVSERKRPVIDAMERLQTARELLKFTRSEAKVKDVGLWRQLGAIEREIDEHDEMLSREIEILSGYAVSSNVLEINRSKLMNFALPIQERVKATVHDLSAVTAPLAEKYRQHEEAHLLTVQH